MLSSKEFQNKEKRTMKKVQIEEDSSEGEDVDFGDANKKDVEPKDILTPLENVKTKDNKTPSKTNPVIIEPKNEKMTEDDSDFNMANMLSEITDLTSNKSSNNKLPNGNTQVNNKASSGTNTSNKDDVIKKLADQESKDKNYISQYSNAESSTVNMMSINKPINQLKETFEKM